MTETETLSATKAGYDAIAEQYAERFRTELDEAPLDKALLKAFAELVARDHADAQILEVGSGPGNVAAYLHQLGTHIRGVDVSPAMVELACRDHPEVTFETGDMGALDVADASLAGVVAWYSLIHIPVSQRPAVLNEFYRLLQPNGYALLAFQVGDDTLHLDEAFGHTVSLDFHRLQPDAVVAQLADAGFDITAQVIRAPEVSSTAAEVPQGILIARKRPVTDDEPQGPRVRLGGFQSGRATTEDNLQEELARGFGQ